MRRTAPHRAAREPVAGKAMAEDCARNRRVERLLRQTQCTGY